MDILILEAKCQNCNDQVKFSNRRKCYYCDDCELEFVAVLEPIEPQTVFLSYAHHRDNSEEFDVSEELVFLIQEELRHRGHSIWIDREGICAGS